MRFLHPLIFLTLSPLLTCQSVPSCPGTFIRKSWDTYTKSEKSLYLQAIKDAMDSGHHQKFSELHTEYFSELEAHRTSTFIYWHRLFLLAYENMLRSLSPAYQCLTLPYWDHLSSTAKRSAGLCTSIEQCASIISDFGGTSLGYTTAPKSTMIVYNVTVTAGRSDRCVTQGVLGNFCGNQSFCSRCVLRGPLRTAYYPAEAYFTSVYRQVFTYADQASFTQAVERGVHNTLHSNAGGILAWLQAPIDPIFYAHHAFVDILQTIHYKCFVGRDNVTSQEAMLDPSAWTNGTRRNGGTFSIRDTITMRVRDNAQKWNDVRSPNNSLYQFFRDLPKTYGQIMDTTAIGQNSYTYQLSGALASMYALCEDSVTLPTANIFIASKSLEKEEQRRRQQPVLLRGNRYDDKVQAMNIAIFESARITGYTDQGARDQLGMIMCLHKETCLGGVQDYSDTFRRQFHVEGHTSCYSIVQALKEEKMIIGIPNWRAIVGSFLPCPTPKGTGRARSYD